MCTENSIEKLVAATSTRLIRHFDLRDCRFEPFPFDRHLPRIEFDRVVLPAAEPGVEPWSLGYGVELPVRFRGLPLGRFVLTPKAKTAGTTFSPPARRQAMAMAAEVSDPLADAFATPAYEPRVVAAKVGAKQRRGA